MANALTIIEEAVGLLREAGFAALATHWTGSVPFALGLLLFWQALTVYRPDGGTPAAGALALTLLLIWMNTWRAVFTIRLRRRLGVADGPARPVRSVARIVQNQTVFAAAKLIVQPVAVIALLPLGWTTAFFRSAAVYSAEDLETAVRRAGRSASFEPGSSWVGLGILAFCAAVLLVNCAAALAMLPYAVKALTGIESAFTRSGPLLYLNPLFFLAVLLSTWLLVDPLAQAFYCVRCFRAESVATGEDLRARIRALRKPAQAAAMGCLFLLMPAGGSAQVAPRQLESAVKTTLESRRYDWRLASHRAQAGGTSWLVEATDGAVRQVRQGLRALRDWLLRLEKWLTGDRKPAHPAASPSPAWLRPLVFVLLGAIVAALVFVLWRLRKRPGADQTPLPGAGAPVDLSNEELTADRLAETEWFALADRLLAQGDPRSALRALFLGSLAWLGATRLIVIDRGKTNREYERELRRRTRETPETAGLFAENVAALERCWYGRHPAGSEDFAGFRRRLDRMKELCWP